MKFKLAISPCPNDTFMFDAIINKRIDTCGFEFETEFHDIEKLNELAQLNAMDITKLSCFSYLNLIDNYIMLNSGAALGFGVGPLLIADQKLNFDIKKIAYYKVLLPGVNTTANFLFTHAYRAATNKFFKRFDLIENAVLNHQYDLGVIIHEGRFTYKNKGLQKICDLGAIWQEKTNMPIPLGCIAIKRTINKTIANAVSNILSKSIQYAFKNPNASLSFIKQHSQELDKETIQNHIHLYVNKFSIDLGTQGKDAISAMYNFTSNNMLSDQNDRKSLFL